MAGEVAAPAADAETEAFNQAGSAARTDVEPGRVVRRLEAGPVGGVEGLDADGAGPVCRGALEAREEYELRQAA